MALIQPESVKHGYRLRAKRKRWQRELAGFKKERQAKLSQIKEHGRVASGSLEYVEGRIKTLEGQLQDIEKYDLRTAEERRGFDRKKYTRVKDIELRGVHEHTVRQIEERHRQMAAKHREQPDPMSIKDGNFQRQLAYDGRKQHLIRELDGAARRIHQTLREEGAATITAGTADTARADEINDQLRALAREFSDCCHDEL